MEMGILWIKLYQEQQIEKQRMTGAAVSQISQRSSPIGPPVNPTITLFVTANVAVATKSGFHVHDCNRQSLSDVC